MTGQSDTDVEGIQPIYVALKNFADRDQFDVILKTLSSYQF